MMIFIFSVWFRYFSGGPNGVFNVSNCGFNAKVGAYYLRVHGVRTMPPSSYPCTHICTRARTHNFLQSRTRPGSMPAHALLACYPYTHSHAGAMLRQRARMSCAFLEYDLLCGRVGVGR